MEKDKFKIIMFILDILCAVLIISALVYFYSHKEETKALLTDPCRVCEDRTGGQCLTNKSILDLSKPREEFYIPPMNFSNINLTK